MIVEARTYRYEPPEFQSGRGTAKCRLAETDLATIAVKRIREGGENTLHMHPNADGFWTVLGAMEGIVIPRTFPNWFESADETEDLEILQVLVCSTPQPGTTRPSIQRVALRPERSKEHSTTE